MTNIRQYDVILSPIITEKSTMASEFDQVTFDVPVNATKPQIKSAVEELFAVKVKAINTIVVRGKTKRFQGTLGKRKKRKKAIVTLEEGQSIDVTTGLS